MDDEEKVKEKFEWDSEVSLIDLLCSQTANDQDVLGRCAQ